MKFLDRQYGVCGESSWINVRIIGQHLFCISLSPLRIYNFEIGAEIVKRCSNCVHFPTEAILNECRCGRRPASVIVKENKRDVVPVLWLSAREGCCCLRKQEPCETRDVHFDTVVHSADASTQQTDLGVATREACAPEIDCPKTLTLVKHDRSASDDTWHVRNQLELDCRRDTRPFAKPRPDPLLARHEVSVTKRSLKTCGIYRPARDL